MSLEQRGPLPRAIGPYRIEGPLGRGGMGVVLAAVDPRSGAQLAVKLLGAQATRETRERFEVEFQAQRRVQHPAVARVLDRGVTDAGQPYLVFERFVGESLADRLRRGPLTERESAQLVAELAEGLTACHAVGVLHRDLKPENVMLTAAGPRLIDFGLALEQDASERLTRTGVLIGTPGYWAPELIRGEKGGAGVATDVYGLGALLYACLTARPPHSALSFQELVRRSTSTPDPPSSHVPGLDRGLDALCLECLASDPGERPEGAQHVARRLRGWLAGAREPRTSRWLPVGVLLAVLLAGALTAWAGLRGGGAPPVEPTTVADPGPDAAQVAELARQIAAAREAYRYAEGQALLETAPRTAEGALPPELAFEAAYLRVARRHADDALPGLRELVGRCEGALQARAQALLALAASTHLLWGEALAAEEAALEAAPDDWLVLRLLGLAAEARATLQPHRPSKDLAAERFTRAREAGDPSAHTESRVVGAQAGGLPNAQWLAACEALAARRPDARVFCAVVGRLGHAHRWDDAVEWGERALRAGPEDVHVQLTAAGAHTGWLEYHGSVDPERVAAVEALLARALESAPHDPWVTATVAGRYQVLGQCYRANGQEQAGLDWVKRARELARASLARYPGSYRHRRLLVDCVRDLEGPQQALQVLAPLLRDHPEQSVMHYQRYVLLCQLQRYEEALDSIEEASRLAPGRDDFKALLARMRQHLGR